MNRKFLIVGVLANLAVSEARGLTRPGCPRAKSATRDQPAGKAP